MPCYLPLITFVTLATATNANRTRKSTLVSVLNRNRHFQWCFAVIGVDILQETSLFSLPFHYVEEQFPSMFQSFPGDKSRISTSTEKKLLGSTGSLTAIIPV
ncbi:hypothetical protein V6N11_039308 [Hibiscus sabdariffa]|uniref:Secreted protein n=1 Tax=Hibiscus sabdariffa TaxID=183260 RepID=A0ABR2SMI8_9ROSI